MLERARIPLLYIIRLYQKTLSMDHGPMSKAFPQGYCRFYPTCSEYGYQAIEKYGVLKGGTMASWRVLRCNPFNKGGHDPVVPEPNCECGNHKENISNQIKNK